MIDAEATCKRCNVCKPASEFYPDTKRKSGLNAYCKPCTNLNLKEWRARNPDKHKAQILRNNRGISLATYNQFNQEQDGRCAICHKLPEEVDARRAMLDVDHDHVTGEIRGLLCANHNKGLGLFSDDPALLRAAAAYLES